MLFDLVNTQKTVDLTPWLCEVSILKFNLTLASKDPIAVVDTYTDLYFPRFTSP